MGIFDNINHWIEERIQGAIFGLDWENDTRRVDMNKAHEYRQGEQPRTIKTLAGNTDDNVVVNFTGLLVDRAAALLFGAGVEFDLPGDGEPPEQVYVDAVWKANKKHELLIDIADYGATYGTAYFYINPDGVVEQGEVYPEINTLDPRFVKIVTEPENYRRVAKYVIEYRIVIDNISRTRRREIIPVKQADETDGVEMITAWQIVNWLQDENGMMVLEGTDAWEYPFPPILHLKNMPEAGSQYGRPDLTPDVLQLQDAINRVVSSTNKAIRLTAFQRLWGKFLGQGKPIMLGMDRILSVDNEKAELNAIDAGSNFEGMIAFQNELRDAMFTISRSTDPRSIKDKVGQITNFGLRVLYKDSIDKLETKRRLYGEALQELNRRLLVLNDMEPDAGEIVWHDPLPQDENELVQAYKFDLEQGIVSKQTIRDKRGYDNENEEERIAAEREEANANNENVGGFVLQNFNRGLPPGQNRR
jgi:hypothetical protein